MRAHLNAQEKRAANRREGKRNRRTNRKINRFAIVISSSTKAEMQTIFVCKTQNEILKRTIAPIGMQSGNTEDLKNIAIKEMQPSKGAKKAIRLQFFRPNYATKRQMKGKKPITVKMENSEERKKKKRLK